MFPEFIQITPAVSSLLPFLGEHLIVGGKNRAIRGLAVVCLTEFGKGLVGLVFLPKAFEGFGAEHTGTAMLLVGVVLSSQSRLIIAGYQTIVAVCPKQQIVEKKRSFPIRLLRLLLRHKSKIDTTRASIIDMINSDKRIRCMPNTYMVGNLFRQAYCNLSFFTIPHANLALAESIICGTVNVAAKTPESIEYSNNGELALLYEFGNEEDFAAKIHSLSKCYDQMIEKIRKGSCAVSEMFDRERNSKILNDLIDRTLNNEE